MLLLAQYVPHSRILSENIQALLILKAYLHPNSISMSKGNNRKVKGPSRFKDAVTGKTYSRTPAMGNVKALKAAAAYAVANPKKEFYT